jgi:hypothetical protein
MVEYMAGKDIKQQNTGNLDRSKEKRPSNFKPKERSKDTKLYLKRSYCQKTGLTENSFSKKQDDKEKGNNANFKMIEIDGKKGKNFHNEMNWMDKKGRHSQNFTDKYNITQDTHIRDSGTMKEYGMPIQVGKETQIYSKGIGSYHGKVIQKDGLTLNIKLQNVLNVAELCRTLFSLTKELNYRSVDVRKEKGPLASSRNVDKQVFNRMVKTGKGKLLGIHIVQNINIYDKL